MRCRRCSGLMVSDAHSASPMHGGVERVTLRCVNCGALVDWSIPTKKASGHGRALQQQKVAVRELRRKYPIRTSMAMQGTTEDE
jgi:hypothetical protein